MPRTIVMKMECFSFTKRATQITHSFGAEILLVVNQSIEEHILISLW